MKRRKGAVLDAPASHDEAVAMVAAYVDGERTILRLRLDSETAMDAIKRERDLAITAIEPDQKARFEALRAWWETGGSEAAGRLRSAEIGGAVLGVRRGMPRLKLARGWRESDLVQRLAALAEGIGERFLRRTAALDKQAIIKAMTGPADVAVQRAVADVVAVVQAEEFFIDARLEDDARTTQQGD